MGERAARHEPATSEERNKMAQIVGTGIKAGALGFPHLVR